jgi:transposase
LLAAKSLEFENQEDKRPIKLFFQDEARFGRIDNVSSCWVPQGARALAGSQIVREYTYLYGVFCPETGESLSLILPYANGDCMEVFLQALSENFSEYRVILAMDNASWHSSKIHIDNIVPLFQPAYSPEVNPAERVWKHIRENGGFKNRTFATLADVEQCLCHAVVNILDKETVKSLTGFSWVMKAVFK